MATTTVATADPQVVKLFMEKLMASEVEKNMTMKQFMGDSEDSAIQKLDALEKSKGDTLNYQIMYKLSGQGKQGDTPLEGYEEDITVKNAQFKIDQLRHAAGKHSRMTDKRSFINYTNSAVKLLSIWFAEWCDEALFIYLSGARGVNDTSGKFASGWPGHASNSITAPDTNHLRYCTDTGLSSTITEMNDTLEVTHLDLANVVIKELQGTAGNAAMRKAKLGGSKQKFINVISPRQKFHLTQAASDTIFEKINIGKIQGGNTTDYIFDDGMEYSDFVIYENVNVRKFTASGVYTGADSGMTVAHRALILGAQAGVIGYGESGGGFDNIKVDTEDFDYGNMVGFAGRVVMGLQKVTFADPSGTSRDLGVFCLDSQAEV